MKKIIVALAGLLPLLNAAQAQNITINGTILSDTAVHGKIYLNYPLNGVLTKDSTEIKNNAYHFEENIPDGGVRCVVTWGRRHVMPDSVVKKYTVAWAEAGKVTSLTHTVDFKKEIVTGSDLNTDLNNLQKEMSLRKRAPDVVVEEFIRNHPSSWLSYVVLDEEIRHQVISPETGVTLYEVLSPDLKKYVQVVKLGERINPVGKTAVGSQAAEFTINDVNDQPVSLSSFRGKYVLVDFWASWCGPCRAENPNVSSAWHKYKDKGFDVLSVSLDGPGQKQAWLDAIKKDHLEWTQVSDLQGMKSAVAVSYNLASIPASFLIDPSGKIIARDLRGQQLENKLKEVIK